MIITERLYSLYLDGETAPAREEIAEHQFSFTEHGLWITGKPGALRTSVFYPWHRVDRIDTFSTDREVPDRPAPPSLSFAPPPLPKVGFWSALGRRFDPRPQRSA